MYLLHIQNFRVLSGLIIIIIFRTLILTPNNSLTVVTKHNTIPSKNSIMIPSTLCVGVRAASPCPVGTRIGLLLSRPYVSRMVYASNGKRTMSITSKQVPVKVYLNPDKDKESIVNENKGRTGIYR